jgi:hypothetical protein
VFHNQEKRRTPLTPSGAKRLQEMCAWFFENPDQLFVSLLMTQKIDLKVIINLQQQFFKILKF